LATPFGPAHIGGEDRGEAAGLAHFASHIARRGVRYVLEGSVRKSAGRVRITAQLIDATTGTHLWADRFDGSLEDVFELQDQVATNVAGVIEPALQAAETARSVTDRRATSAPMTSICAPCRC